MMLREPDAQRDEAEALLAASDERFQRVSEAAFEGILITEAGTIVDANERLAEMFGYTVEKLRGLSARVIIAAESHDAVRRHLETASESPGEAVAVKSDGTRFDIEFRSRLLHTGDRARRISAIHDITDRKRDERALQESEERFRRLAEATFEGVAFSENGTIIDCNSRMAEMFGYTIEELRGRHASTLVAPESFDHVKRHIESGSEGTYEYIGLRKDGSRFDVEVNGRVLNQGGRVGRISGLRDVTARKQVEAVLRESEERFRIVANDTPAYLWISSEREENTYINRALAAFLGTPENRLGSKWNVFVHPDDRSRTAEMFRRCLEKRVEYRDEFRLRRFDAEYRWVVNQGVPRSSPDGAFIGYAGSLVDVTDVKRAEHRLRAAHDRLALELAERTRAEAEIVALSQSLLNAQEEERTRIARELHDDLGQRIAGLGISLSAIKRRLPENASEVRDEMEQAHQRLMQVAELVRHLSHDLHPAMLENLGLAPALKSYGAEFKSMTGVSVRVEATDSFADVPAAIALGILRIAQEALQNVLKHAAVQHATVHLTRTGSVVSLRIADVGVGCNPTEVATRSGLGLVSMRERARLLGGTFRFESAAGKGTMVSAAIPIPPIRT